MIKKVKLSNIIILIAIILISYPLFLGNLINKIFISNKDYDNYIKNPTKLDTREIDNYNNSIDANNFNRGGSMDVFGDPNSSLEGKEVDQHDLDKIRQQKGFEEVIGLIKIPSIKEEILLFYDATHFNLERGAAIMKNTSMPSHNKKGIHTILAGHRGMTNLNVFKNIDKMKKGDSLIIEMNGENYEYVMKNSIITTPDRSDLIKFDENKNLLTIVTCHPYLVNNKRLLVFFEKK